jgi:NADPH-dependent glutamate synthase beta subunit-like oxidoreductase/NAD(P)H-flavin reductase
MTTTLHLAFDLTFPDLYARDGLVRLDVAFRAELQKADATLAEQYETVRAHPDALPHKETSDLLMAVAPHVEDFIGKLFGISAEIHTLAKQHYALAPLYACKRLFVQRRAARAHKADEAAAFDPAVLRRALEHYFGEAFSELAFATHVMGWLDGEAKHEEPLAVALKYAAWAVHMGAHADGIIFTQPHKLDMENLVHAVHHYRQRNGFDLTDSGAALDKALEQANYCIFCHHQGRDSCSKGLKEKDGTFKKTVFDITQAGCPLEEHISEMNELKAKGVPVGALGMAIIANPMLAGTGHRICNDCMKACIYQKQEPVDIPQVETRTLKDVLALPWGFEIYSLLTRWNPLNLERPLPREASNKNVLVVGLGPAGYTLSHHLMNDGHTVVAVDGLKIEPLPADVSGVDQLGARTAFTPICDIEHIKEPLGSRVLAGFGGVAEYGITVRWDKNYLKIIRLLLERREQFAMIGGVRFGGTLTIEQAWEMGFDHVALCMGAGKPTVLNMPNGVARGVRTASDFLMALQLTGAAKADSIANLQLRLPVVVIGGGLTAIDTATESLAYYPVQVEKFLNRYESLGEPHGLWTVEEQEVADTFISHARAIREERKKDHPDIVGLLQRWGGVKMVYRKRLMDSPSYRLNHEEVQKALEEGIEIVENFAPQEVLVDEHGHAKAIRCMHSTTGEERIFDARAVLIAAGTSPNTVLHREFPDAIELDGRYFRAMDENGEPVSPERLAKPAIPHVLMSKDAEGRAVSFFGDLHPSFAGNVVKAMGSAKQGYPVVSRVLQQRKAHSDDVFLEKIHALLRPQVVKVERLTPTIVEVVMKAPMAARNFQPGQFYRLQNFEANALRAQTTTLAMEGLAMTGAWVDKDKGLISVIALEMGGSSDLCAHLQAGEPVVLMGPTGSPTDIPANQTVALVGGGLGNAVLFSIGRALKEAGSNVLYFAGYKQAHDRYKVEEIEAASDVVVWCCDEKAPFSANRPQDKTFHGNMLQAMEAYAKGELGETTIALSDVDHMVVIGSDRMMAAVASARHSTLAPYVKQGHEAIGSINSPMQCMMKEICAQCLQQHIDPQTGAITYVYSCYNQDQPLDNVSFIHLNERLRQNTVQEKLTKLWIDRCLKTLGHRKQAA